MFVAPPSGAMACAESTDEQHRTNRPTGLRPLTLIKTIGYLIAFLMGIGAVFGAINTMYNAVASRTREIATLRAIGFGSLPVVASVIGESLALATAGGPSRAIDPTSAIPCTHRRASVAAHNTQICQQAFGSRRYEP